MGKGKMGGALSAWLKEFCALVFIQSIQAFTFAIIMVMVINLVKGESANSKAAPLGMVAVVAMASISKLEDLVKKMFGIGPSVTDPSLRGGMKSWATGMVAFGAAKRVADNGKKLFGGIGGIAAGSRAKKSALQKKQQFLNEYAKLHGVSGAAGGAPRPANGNDEGDAGGNGGASGSVGRAGNVSYNDYMKYKDRLESYDEKINEAKKNQRAAIKDIAKGVFETGGAMAGAVSGAAFSAATGDADTILKSALTGAGAGDVLGEKVVDIPVSVSTTIKNVSDGSGKRAIKREIKQKKAEVDKYFKDNGFDVSDTQ